MKVLPAIFNCKIDDNWLTSEYVMFLLSIGGMEISTMGCRLVTSEVLMESPDFENFWLIEEINTKIAYQDKGFGTVLLKHGCAGLKKKQDVVIVAIPALDLDNPKITQRLEGWYERCGFKKGKGFYFL